MKPTGNLPVAPLLREKLKQRNELSVQLPVAELKKRVTTLSGGEREVQQHAMILKSLEMLALYATQNFQLMLIEKQHRGFQALTSFSRTSKTEGRSAYGTA